MKLHLLVLSAILSGFLPLDILWQLVSIGTLLAFAIVSNVRNSAGVTQAASMVGLSLRKKVQRRLPPDLPAIEIGLQAAPGFLPQRQRAHDGVDADQRYPP